MVLQKLETGHTRVSSLDCVDGMTALRELGLADTAVTDAGLEHLKDLRALQQLDLAGTNVTDRGLECLGADGASAARPYGHERHRHG